MRNSFGPSPKPPLLIASAIQFRRLRAHEWKPVFASSLFPGRGCREAAGEDESVLIRPLGFPSTVVRRNDVQILAVTDSGEIANL